MPGLSRRKGADTKKCWFLTDAHQSELNLANYGVAGRPPRRSIFMMPDATVPAHRTGRGGEEIVIARAGRPVARLAPLPGTSARVGCWVGWTALPAFQTISTSRCRTTCWTRSSADDSRRCGCYSTRTSCSWSIAASRRLPAEVRDLLVDPPHTVLWQRSERVRCDQDRTGPQGLPRRPAATASRRNATGFAELPVNATHAARVATLPDLLGIRSIVFSSPRP